MARIERIPDPNGAKPLPRMTPRQLFEEIAPGSMDEHLDSEHAAASGTAAVIRSIRARITNTGVLDITLGGLQVLAFRTKLQKALAGNTGEASKAVSFLNSFQFGKSAQLPDKIAC